MLDLDLQLDLFHGEATPNRAHVYARLPKPAGEGWSLAGTIRGPHCLYSSMLPATIRFADAGPGPTLLARAVLPDPVYWSMELPALYDVQLELRQGSEVVAATTRTFGLRWLGARGRFFYQESRRFVIRGMAQETDPAAQLLAWHDLPAVMCAHDPADPICDEASRAGVMIVAGIDAQPAHVEAELRRLARHAAVAVVAVKGAPVNAAWKAACSNLILAQWLDAETPIDANADALLAMVDEPALFAARLAATDKPVIAWRPWKKHPADLAAGRAAVDQLQADLAPHGDFAGYLV